MYTIQKEKKQSVHKHKHKRHIREVKLYAECRPTFYSVVRNLFFIYMFGPPLTNMLIGQTLGKADRNRQG